MKPETPETLLEQLPRRRARRRSPLREPLAGNGEPNGAGRAPTPDPFATPRAVDAEAVAAVAEGMRAVAEVADLALTATALVLREVEAKLKRPPADGED